MVGGVLQYSDNPPLHDSIPSAAGEVAEWSIAAVLKTASASPPTGVRIPPSPPVRKQKIVSDLVRIAIWVAVVGVLFGVLWRKGYLARLTLYVQQTREELRKCTWPTWDELKGSTVVVAVSILLLGGFTVLVDFVFAMLVRWIT